MRRSGTTPVWAFVVGALFAFADRVAVLRDHEGGGALMLGRGIALPIGVVLASHHGRGASGRAIRSR